MTDESIAPAEPPRQGLTYLRVMGLAMCLKDGLALAITDEELAELFRAWLRLTDLDPSWQQRVDPHWQQRGQANG